MEPKRYTGRPSKNKNKLYESPLYKLLLEKLPSEFIKFGRIDTDRLSKETGNARYTTYRWFDLQSLSKKAAKSLLEISQNTDESEKKGALTKEDLLPFYLDF